MLSQCRICGAIVGSGHNCVPVPASGSMMTGMLQPCSRCGRLGIGSGLCQDCRRARDSMDNPVPASGSMASAQTDRDRLIDRPYEELAAEVVRLRTRVGELEADRDGAGKDGLETERWAERIAESARVEEREAIAAGIDARVDQQTSVRAIDLLRQLAAAIRARA